MTEKERSGTDLVGASRDGDAYHYYYAANRCLELLSPTTNLKAVTIEGGAVEDRSANTSAKTAEIIDIAQYYGSTSEKDADRIVYLQLKHSTHRGDKGVTASELRNTIAKFGEIYAAHVKLHGANSAKAKLRFKYVCNRPIADSLNRALQRMQSNAPPYNGATEKSLLQDCGLRGAKLQAFLECFKVCGKQSSLVQEAQDYRRRFREHVSSNSEDLGNRLYVLIGEQALTKSSNLSITQDVVLGLMNREKADLFPAINKIEEPEFSVDRAQYSALADAIIVNDQGATIVHAVGGVGKSHFSSNLKGYLPKGSEAIVFDCFGNGDYRKLTGQRHTADSFVTQVVNELAAKNLCKLLIPVSNTDNAHQMRTLLRRLDSAAFQMRAINPDALMCLVVDAADNAQSVAQEKGNGDSFQKQLLKETMPEGVRLVMTSRSHRVDELAPPMSCQRLELESFDGDETRTLVEHFGKGTNDSLVSRFHYRTSGNPRVQHRVLSSQSSLAAIINELGPDPVSSDGLIQSELQVALSKLVEASTDDGKARIKLLCDALSTLPPNIPVSSLEALTGLSASEISSFGFDMEMAIRRDEAFLMFRNEPTETWFRNKFKPNQARLREIGRFLLGRIDIDEYAARVAPHLLLAAGEFDIVIETLQKFRHRQGETEAKVQYLRKQWITCALKAAIQLRRYDVAASLSFELGSVAATSSRQGDLFWKHPDLYGVFSTVEDVEDSVSERKSRSMPSHQRRINMSAAFAFCDLQKEKLNSSVLEADRAVNAWLAIPREDRKSNELDSERVAYLTLGCHAAFGLERAIYYIQGWRPARFRFQSSYDFTRLLVDHFGPTVALDVLRIPDVEPIALMGAVVAISEVACEFDRQISEILWEAISEEEIEEHLNWGDRQTALMLDGICVAATWVKKHELATPEVLSARLLQLLPKLQRSELQYSSSGMRKSVLQAFTMASHLAGEPYNFTDALQMPPKRDGADDNDGPSDYDKKCEKIVTSLGVWHRLSARLKFGDVENFATDFEATQKEARDALRVNHVQERETGWDDIVELVWEMASLSKDYEEHARAEIDRIGRDHHISDQSRLRCIRRSAHCAHLTDSLFDQLQRAFSQIEAQEMLADEKVDGIAKISRALLAAHKDEAFAYWQKAMEIATAVGEEYFDGWKAIYRYANCADTQGHNAPELAYKVSRVAELGFQHFEKKYFGNHEPLAAVAAIDLNSAFAVLARWHDHGVDYDFEGLNDILAKALEQKNISPISSLLFSGFAEVDRRTNTVQEVLSKAPPNQIEGLAEVLLPYFSFDLSILPAPLRIKLEGLPEYRELGREKPATDDLEKSEELPRRGVSDEKPEMQIDWDACFEGFDAGYHGSIDQCIGRANALGYQVGQDEIWQRTIQRVPDNQRVQFINALCNSEELGVWRLRDLWSQIPANWLRSRALQSALKDLFLTVMAANWPSIEFEAPYPWVPYKELQEKLELKQTDFVQRALENISASNTEFDGETAYRVAYLLSWMTGAEQNATILNDALGFISLNIPESLGDGPWQEAFQPPADTNDAIAAFLWAALGKPEANMRWQATHVVRDLYLFGDPKIIRALIARAGVGAHPAFVALGFPAYELHSLQWFLIAIDAGLVRRPDGFSTGQEFLLNCLVTKKHVLVRELCKRCLLKMSNTSWSADDWQSVETTNISQFEKVKEPVHRFSGRGDSVDVPMFALDFGPYWFEPLIRRFGVDDSFVDRINDLLRNGSLPIETAKWDVDPRHSTIRGNEYRFTEHSHGTYPRYELCSFYVAYHLLMEVAAELIDTTPLLEKEISYEENFQEWIDEHLTTLSSGFWIADFRGPTPKDCVHFDYANDGNLPEITDADFLSIVLNSDSTYLLWGHWPLQSVEFNVSINSALVAPDKSLSLALALKSSENPFDFYLAPHGDDREISEFGFELRGWVASQHGSKFLDEKDPWSGDISFPYTAPADCVSERFGLVSDNLNRIWFKKEVENEAVIWSRSWGTERAVLQEDSGSSGDGLFVSKEFLKAFLSAEGMNMIVEVQISPNYGYGRDRWPLKTDHGSAIPLNRVLIVEADGKTTVI